MRLIAKFEVSQHPNMAWVQSFRSDLYLHDAIDWQKHETPEALWELRGMPVVVHTPPRDPRARVILRSSLRVLAPDGLDDARVARTLEEQREALLRSPGSWIASEGIWARFERDDAVVSEQDTILDQLTKSARQRLLGRRKRMLLRVEELVLQRFRAFTDVTLSPSAAGSTVLVGVNGSGKTTLLEGAALLLAQLIESVRRAPLGLRLMDDDITNDTDTTKLTIKARVGASELTWNLGRARGRERSIEQSRANLDDEIDQMRDELEACWPVIAHYRVNRAVVEVPLGSESPAPLHLDDPYDGAMDRGGINFRVFFRWFYEREYLEREARIDNPDDRDHQLTAVRDALKKLVPMFGELRAQGSPPRMLIRKDDAQLRFDQLSDGEKCLLAMVGDLACRLAMANPLADEPLLGGGVVLIDEIELHLHPGLQRMILPLLQSVFPNMQFVITTHSPQVLSSVRSENVRLIDHFSLRKVDRGTWHRDTNRILEAVFSDPGRPPDVAEKLNQLRDAVDDDRFEEARALLKALRDMVEGEDPDLFFYEQLLPPSAGSGTAA